MISSLRLRAGISFCCRDKTSSHPEVIDPDLPIDCAEFDVGPVVEALRSAQGTCGSIVSRTAHDDARALELSRN